MEAGVEAGRRQEKQDIARHMKNSGLDPGTIVQAIGLSPEEIREL